MCEPDVGAVGMAFTVIVTILDVTGFAVGQITLDVKTQVIWLLLTGTYV